MGMHNIDRYICFAGETYESEKEKWEDIMKTTTILIKNDYEVLISKEDFGNVIIRYEYSPYMDLGGERFVTVTEEEYEELLELRRAKTDGDME